MDDPTNEDAPEVEVIDITTPEGQREAGVLPPPDDVPVENGETITTVIVSRKDIIVECPLHGLETKPSWRVQLQADRRAYASKRAGQYAIEAYITLALAMLEALHSEGVALATEGELKDPQFVAGMGTSAH